MTCYAPISGYRAKSLNPNGKRPIVFNTSTGYADMPIQVKCGQCIGCRLDYAKSWAIRSVHEAQLHEDNCFITLTYNDKNLPSDGSLIKWHYQDFLKRLRKHLHPKKIRYTLCGEYGEKYDRPHYHAIIFNHDFTDKELYKEKDGTKLYLSPTLDKIWGKGMTTVGDVTLDSASYVARYILKKQNSNTDINISDETYNQAILADGKYYSKTCLETGLMSHPIQPEFFTMSRRPGIAYQWYKKFKKEIYPDDFIVIKGVKMKPPKYYDSLYEEDNLTGTQKIKKRRKTLTLKKHLDNTHDRLRVREECQQAKIKHKTRNLGE